MNRVFYIGVLAVIVPLLFIAISIAISPWFDLVNNALSDLGHAVNSDAAPFFNFGLSTGGLLMVLTAVLITGVSWIYRSLIGIAGYFLMLIGVFDEVYGRLHFYVSVLFFVTLLLLLIVYGYVERKPLPIAPAVIGITSWYLHFTQDMPPGAAIPELISITIALPVYLEILCIKSKGTSSSISRKT
ncbi:MAG: DUF998 domain-containing protein [Desulfurococcales archaeon]|nr:DUF998 domain-containing protein [Desulfurococcales archaeon]